MLENPEKSIMDSIDAGIEKIIVPSASPDNFQDVIELTKLHDVIFGALGVHPEDVLKYTDTTSKDIFNLVSKNEKIIAIGEIGLDYYYGRENKEAQIKIFENQLEVALALDLPVLIHDREAHNDTSKILKKFNIKKAVLHCFSGSVEFAKECIKEGYYIGIGGIVTFKNSKKMKEVVKEIPLTSILLETDAPYLTPHPFRGEENSPKYLQFIAKAIADIKDTTFEEVCNVTTENAKRFFNL